MSTRKGFVLRLLNKAFNLLYYILLMHIILLFTSLLPNFQLMNKIRGFLLKPFFKKCGKNFQVARGIVINYSRNIEIGNDVYIAHDAWVNGTGGLTIGDRVIISPKVVIATTKHVYENGSVNLLKSENGPINIGAGTWIASNSTITLNTNIGEGCIIGACSSVTKDIPDYSFAGGVPAKVIKSLR
jgi:acetyltransferase-like isoleucine patch superfamily enzyme